MTVGPALPPGFRQQEQDAEASDDAPAPALGPPLPPGLTSRSGGGGGDSAGFEGTLCAEKASGPAALGPALPPGLPASIGPALPPGLATRGAPAVGPSPPPSAPENSAERLSRKREWDRVRSAEAPAKAGDEGAAAHPGDEGREEWMTVAPVFDKRQSMLAARGLPSGLVPAEKEDAGRAQGPPRRPSDVLYEADGGGEAGDEDSDGAGEETGVGEVMKRPRYAEGPSLLEQHVARGKEAAARRPGEPKYRQFDREKEFSDHKKRDASFYKARGGDLYSNYGPAQRERD